MAVRGVIVASPGTGSYQEIVPWWSFTKSILAVAALVLVGQRRLNLDEPVEGKPFSLRHLLQHTSGLPDYGNLAEYHADVAAGKEPWQREELLWRVKANELLFVPGTSWAYSNVGYLFVREIIERTTGDGLDRALRALVFDPLGAQGAFVATAIQDLVGTVWGNEKRYHPGWVYHGLVVGPAPTAALILERLLYGPLRARFYPITFGPKC